MFRDVGYIVESKTESRTEFKVPVYIIRKTVNS